MRTDNIPSEPNIIETNKIPNGNHETIKLFIMIHGLNGSRNDLVRLSESIKLMIPTAKFYFCSANEKLCKDGLKKMAYRLADEINIAILPYAGVPLLSVSFMCHSFGGLVLRESLKYLAASRHLFVSYVSFCTPHLGSLSDRFLVKTGLKFLSIIPKLKTYSELGFKDDEKVILKLSERQELSWFKNVVLVGTIGDGMVNHHSALIRMPDNSNDPQLAKIVDNMTEQMRNSKVVRLPITIKSTGSKIDDFFIGNQIHVKVLFDASIHMPILQEIKDILI
jgi:hypothetical protein